MIDHALNPYAAPRVNVDRAAAPAGVLTAATPVSRLAAASIDGLLLLPLAFAGFFLIGLLQSTSGDGARSLGKGAMLLLAPCVLYFVGIMLCQVVMLTKHGQTVGKRVIKIRIVKLDGSPPGFLHAVLLRMIVNGLPPAIPAVGRLYTLVDLLFIFRADRRCLHDLIAGTRVVRVEPPLLDSASAASGPAGA